MNCDNDKTKREGAKTKSGTYHDIGLLLVHHLLHTV